MIKMLLAAAVLISAGGLAGPAIAQDKRVEKQGGEVSPSLAKLEAQCAHRRVMPPDPRDDCARRLRSNAQLGYGQDNAYASSYEAGPGIGPGNAGSQGNSIGPGKGGGAGQGKGRR